MKKLYIMMATIAAICNSAFASACYDDDVEEVQQCYLWDISMNLKTLGAKAAKCNKNGSVCDDVDDPSYYMVDTTRKLKGYIWSCEYSCDTWNIVLWDEKNKVAVIPLDPTGENQATISTEDALIYGKKATKAAASFAIADDSGETLDVFACGSSGKLVRKNADDNCYVKSLSGNVCGRIAYIKPGFYSVVKTNGSLCEDPVVDVIDNEYFAKTISWCDACCFDNWCDDGEEAPDMVPCTGTWRMKFNKNLASGKKGNIAGLVPAYAL